MIEWLFLIIYFFSYSLYLYYKSSYILTKKNGVIDIGDLFDVFAISSIFLMLELTSAMYYCS